MSIDNIYWISKDKDGSGRLYLYGYNNQAVITGINTYLQAPIEVSPIPLRGSTGALSITYTGTVKTIKIQGIFSGPHEYLKSGIDYLESLQDGAQKDTTNKMGYHFRSGFQDKIFRVGIELFRYNWREADASTVSYDLTLKEIA